MEAESQSELAVTIAPPRAPQRGEQLPLRQWEGSSEAEWEVWQPPVPLSTQLSPWLLTEQLREGHISAACV